jgi:hypothetical protein
MDTPHLICVTYYPLWFVMLPTTLFETEMTTLSQDVVYRYTILRSSRLSHGGANNERELSSVRYASDSSRDSGKRPPW